MCTPTAVALSQIENVIASRRIAENDLRKNIFEIEDRTFQVASGSNTENEDLYSRTNY